MPGQDGAAAAEDTPHRRLDARLAVAAGVCWCVTVLGIWCGATAAWGAAAAAVVAAGLLAVRGRRARIATVAGTAAAILLVAAGFAAATGLRVHAADSNPVRGLYGQSVQTVMRIDGDPRLLGEAGDGQRYGAGRRVLLHGSLESVRLGGQDRAARGRVVVFAPSEGWGTLVPGQRVRFAGRIGPPLRRGLTVAAVRVRGAPYEVGAPSRLQRIAGGIRERFAQVCARVLGVREAGLVRGLVLGDESGMPPQTGEQFATAGLTHLTAVSGSNFALVCGMVLLLARPLGPRTAALITALAIAGFVVLVRPSPSVLRAAAMGMIGLGALITGRRRQALPALAATVLVLLAWSPRLSVDAGFAMSAGATAALVVIVPVWVDRLRAHGWPSVPAQAAAVAVAAHLVTVPVVAAISGTVSLVAVAANLLAAPAVAPATVCGALAAVFAGPWPWAAELLARGAGPPAWWLVHVAQWCAQAPLAQITVPGGLRGAVLTACAVTGVCGWYVSRRFRWCAVAATVAAEAVWLPAHWTGLP